jgi:hypothetical protein
MKTRAVGSELFHADGRSDGQTHRHEEANSRLSQFCKHAKKRIFGWDIPLCYMKEQMESRSRLGPEILYRITSATFKHQITLKCHLMYN